VQAPRITLERNDVVDKAILLVDKSLQWTASQVGSHGTPRMVAGVHDA
jgi:hypothetical protein